ncbi:MAG: YceI family protein [Blastocatellia bacterium]|nr:YceI family protein [Blastocatellia bacterium]
MARRGGSAHSACRRNLRCADPAADKPKATVGAPSNAAPTSPAPTSSGGRVIALTHLNTSVEFTGSKVTGSHEGYFKKLSGSVQLDPASVEKSSVNVEIDTTSVTTDADGLTEHLKSADFFDVVKFPKAAFSSTKITAKPGEKGSTHEVTGDFEIHGVKKSITFPASIVRSGDAVAMQAEFSINRKDFGIVYAGKADDLIRDNVVLKLTLNTAAK